MSTDTPGYSHLIEHHRLAARPLPVRARIDTRIRGRQTEFSGDQEILLFEEKYRPENNLIGHLQFALRYEGINLEVLSLLFSHNGERELNAWLA